MQGHHGDVEQIRCSLDGDEVRHDSILLTECDAVYLVTVSHTQHISKAIVIQIKVSVIKVNMFTLQETRSVDLLPTISGQR